MQGSPRVGPPEAHVLETEIDDEISLYNVQNENVIVLNITASDVWRLCDGEQTFDEIVGMISNAYGVAEDEIRDDVSSTIDQFVDAGFLPPLQ